MITSGLNNGRSKTGVIDMSIPPIWRKRVKVLKTNPFLTQWPRFHTDSNGMVEIWLQQKIIVNSENFENCHKINFGMLL